MRSLTVLALILTILAGCSSSSTTNIVASGSGGAGSSGGSSSVGGDGTGLGGATSNSAALHVPTTDLGDGRVQLSYDFSTTDQLLDWVAAPPSTTMVTVGVGQLVVASSSDLGAAVLRRRIWVTHLAFAARITSGDHLNWYVNTVWDGNFNPARGVGGIHRSDGRHFTIDGNFSGALSNDTTSAGTTYNVSVDVTDTQVTWNENDVPLATQGTFSTDRSRIMALGSYGGTVTFSNIVIEGYLGQDTFMI
jgi:hypothetical protein